MSSGSYQGGTASRLVPGYVLLYIFIQKDNKHIETYIWKFDYFLWELGISKICFEYT